MMPATTVITGLSARCLQALALKGVIPGATKLGGQWTFDEERLRAWSVGEPDKPYKPSLKNAVLYEDFEIPPIQKDCDHEGYVYVIGYGAYVKIGWTVAFRDRFTTLRGSIPHTLFIYRLISAKRELEADLHDRFKRHRVQGEWFWLYGLRQWIEAGYPL